MTNNHILGNHSENCKCKISTRVKKKKTTCYICNKQTNKVLDLCGTTHDICSFECEEKFWFDILY